MFVLVAAYGSPVARTTCESPFSRLRVKTWWAVDGATPAATSIGPRRLRTRRGTMPLITAWLVPNGLVRERQNARSSVPGLAALN